jgi:hypothetical protein
MMKMVVPFGWSGANDQPRCARPPGKARATGDTASVDIAAGVRALASFSLPFETWLDAAARDVRQTGVASITGWPRSRPTQAISDHCRLRETLSRKHWRGGLSAIAAYPASGQRWSTSQKRQGDLPNYAHAPPLGSDFDNAGSQWPLFQHTG